MPLFRPLLPAFDQVISSRATPGIQTSYAVISGESKTPKRASSSSRKMSDRIKSVFTSESPAPIGPYSQAVKANDMVFLSGMMPATPDGKQVQGSVADKTHQMCRNAQAVLEAAGSELEKAVKVTVYFSNLDDFREMNEVYATYFPYKPARSAIEAKRLPAGTEMEMDIIALQ